MNGAYHHIAYTVSEKNQHCRKVELKDESNICKVELCCKDMFACDF